MFRFLGVIILILSISLSKAQGPGFLWAKRLGSSGSGAGSSICVSNSGEIFTTGGFLGSVDFDPGPGVFLLNSLSNPNDVFVSKLDANGNFVWARSFQGSSDDFGNSIKVDFSGNVYITGYFQGTVDFDPSPGSYSLTSTGNLDIFLVKLDVSGNFLWAKSFGSATNDYGSCVLVDNSGSVYFTGYFSGSVDFDPGPGAFSLSAVGSNDIFICKLDDSGNFIWAKSMGGSGDEGASSIAFDSSGNICGSGTYNGSVDFDPGVGSFYLTSVANSFDLFVFKLDVSGNFIWARSMGGNSDDYSKALTVDFSDNIYTTGTFIGNSDFDPGPGNYFLSSAGSEDVYLSKLNSSGNFVWCGKLGGVQSDAAYSIATDLLGNVYTVGEFQGTSDFDPGVSTFTLNSPGNFNIFISKIDVIGGFLWAAQIGGPNWDLGTSVFIDVTNNIYITGRFFGTCDFNPDTGVFNLSTNSGSTDIFILKMAPCCAGFEEYDQNKKFISVYPNPNRGEFSIDVPQEEKNVRVVLYNLMGQIVFTQSLNAGINTIQAKLDKGLYLARLQGDTFTSEAAKVIVE